MESANRTSIQNRETENENENEKEKKNEKEKWKKGSAVEHHNVINWYKVNWLAKWLVIGDWWLSPDDGFHTCFKYRESKEKSTTAAITLKRC